MFNTVWLRAVDGTEGGDVLPEDTPVAEDPCPPQGSEPEEGEEACCGMHHPVLGLC